MYLHLTVSCPCVRLPIRPSTHHPLTSRETKQSTGMKQNPHQPTNPPRHDNMHISKPDKTRRDEMRQSSTMRQMYVQKESPRLAGHASMCLGAHARTHVTSGGLWILATELKLKWRVAWVAACFLSLTRSLARLCTWPTGRTAMSAVSFSRRVGAVRREAGLVFEWAPEDFRW